MLKVGEKVLARYTTLEWYPGEIKEIYSTNPKRYVVEFFDKDVVKGIMGCFILPFEIDNNARHSYLHRVRKLKYNKSKALIKPKYDDNYLINLSKKERRKEMNRRAAKLSRDRKNKSTLKLKEENHELHKIILELKTEIEILKTPFEPIPNFLDFETQLDFCEN